MNSVGSRARRQRHRRSSCRRRAPPPISARSHQDGLPGTKGAADASERATGAESPLPEGIRCTQCGCAFVDAAAYDAHRPDGKCVKPTEAGLVVANRGVVWLESARHLERP